MISPFTTFIYFSILTTIYFVLKFMLTEKHDSKNKSLGIALGICYLIIMILLQLSSNMANAKEKCGGTPQTIAAINYTIIPNLFIFGALLMVMMFFPGWKAPFSNTIGYLCVKWSVNDIFINMLDEGKTKTNKLLKMVYSDPSMMINEMTPENFNLFISRMTGKEGGIGPIVDAKAVQEGNKAIPSVPPLKGGRRKQKGGGSGSILNSNYKKSIPELYNLVVIKDKIAEFLWYMFTGYLVIQNSDSYINTIKCKRSPDELEAKLTNMMDNPKKKKKKQKWKLGY